MVSNSGCQPGKRLLARYFRILSCVLPSSLVIHNLSEENDDMQIKFLDKEKLLSCALIGVGSYNKELTGFWRGEVRNTSYYMQSL